MGSDLSFVERDLAASNDALTDKIKGRRAQAFVEGMVRMSTDGGEWDHCDGTSAGDKN